MRLNIPAGTAVRFEPGEEKEVELTEFGGTRVIHGGNGLVGGAMSDSSLQKRAIERARKTVRNMRWFEVTETRGYLEEGKIAHWQVTLKVGFTLD